MSWLIENWIEVAGVIISLTYLYFSVKQRIWLWPFGLLSAIFYIDIYFSNRLYADMGLQLYYVLISIYGWVSWGKKISNSGEQYMLRTRRVNKSLYLRLLIYFLILTILIFQVLNRLTDSDVPFWDAFTSAGGIIGTWMLARKYIENWLVWIIVDSVSIVLYLYKGLFATTILFVIYTIIAYLGYKTWLRELKPQKG